MGDQSALEPISKLLASGEPANLRDALLLALAELATPAEFEHRAPAALAGSRGYKEALRYARYRTAPVSGKPAICIQLLRSQMLGHREIAVRCLLDAGRAHDLRPYAAVDLEVSGRAALVRNEIRRAGWRVIDTDIEFCIEPGRPRKSR